jgi:hypothetical protein
MFILNDVDLSNYGRGRDRVKRKSRGNLLRNAAIGVGGLAVAGGLGYLALRGKGKAVTQPSITKPSISSPVTSNTEIVKKTSKSEANLSDEQEKWLKNTLAEMERKSNIQARKTYLGSVELAENTGNISAIERILKKEGLEVNRRELNNNMIRGRKSDLGWGYDGDDTYNGMTVGQIMRNNGGLKTIKDKKLRKKVAKYLVNTTVPKQRDKYENLRSLSRKQRILDMIEGKTPGIGRERYEVAEQRAWYRSHNRTNNF